MAATELFAMENPYSTCTAASLTWCHMMLSGATPRSDHFEKESDQLKRTMHVVGVGALDHDPTTQISMLGFEAVVSNTNGAHTTSQAIADTFSANGPHTGIFWNSFHTMAYRYHHHDKRYFDNNVGLYKAKKTKDIVAKMEQVRGGYGEPWSGYIVLKLSDRRLRLPPVGTT